MLDSAAVITGSIVACNTNGDLTRSEESSFSGSYDLIGDGSELSGSTILTGDPELRSLADNGGPTETMALSPDSPAVGAGSLSYGPADDQRGMTRPSSPDLGAFQSLTPPSPTNVTAASIDDTDTLVSWDYSGPTAQAFYIAALGPGQTVADVDPIWVSPSNQSYAVSGLDSDESYTFDVWVQAGGLPSAAVEATSEGQIWGSPTEPFTITPEPNVEVEGQAFSDPVGTLSGMVPDLPMDDYTGTIYWGDGGSSSRRPHQQRGWYFFHCSR